MKDKLIKDPVLWQCTLCDTCDESCPQNVALTDIFYVLKNLAALEGYLPDAYKAQSKTMFDYGVTIPYSDALARRRKELGLEQSLEENISIPLEELQALMDVTGMKQLVDTFKIEKPAKASKTEESE